MKPQYQGDGNHSVRELEALCRQYEEFYHQQATKYTSQPCRHDEEDACEHWEAEFYGVYERKWHCTGSEFEWICNVETREEADRIVNLLNRTA
jgi:hypothetical protein